MRAAVHPEENQKKLEYFRHALSELYPKKTVEMINEQEKINVSNTIKDIQFPYGLKNILHYVNQKTADLMAASSHSLLNELGNQCSKFHKEDSLNQYVQADSGLVVAKKGGFRAIYTYIGSDSIYFTGGICEKVYFSGQGIFNISTKCWNAAPGSYHEHRGTGLDLTRALQATSAAHNVPFSILMPLISPIHVAVIIADKGLITELTGKGASLEDDYNTHHLMPAYFAVIQENVDIIEFMIQQGLSKAIALKCAVESGSFAIIEKLLDMDCPITDDVLEAALKRDRKNMKSSLYPYLSLRISMDVEKKVKQSGAWDALKIILNYSVISVPSLMALFYIAPTILDHIENVSDGNSHLHQLVINKDTARVAALLEACFQASFKKIDGFVFDIEAKNRVGKTILDLALTHGNQEVIAAILMYNPEISENQQKLLLNIKIPAIHQKKEKRFCTIIGQQSQQLEVQKQALEYTMVELISTKEDLSEIKQLNAQIIKKLEMQDQMLQHFAQLLSVNMTPMNMEVPDQHRQLLQMAPNSLFFIPQEDKKIPEPNKIKEFNIN